MNLFLDSSVLLAACGSIKGASRAIFREASKNHWNLIVSPYVTSEVLKNLKLFPATATDNWISLRPNLALVDDILTLDRVAVFSATKDRPILFTALCWSDVLLTLDRADFYELLGKNFYGLEIMKPGVFLERERAFGRLR
ncbi:MAG: hypothetical protein M3Y82_05190 [Verrucomicrobiota bacterium]|nr:hypothetical protein [Verrucomicrobiota bacterium]